MEPLTASGTYEPGWWERRLPVYARRNTALLAYVAAVVVGGVALLALRGASVAELATVPFLVWLIISVAAELLWLETLAGDGTDSMASTVNFAVIFLLAPGLALWVIGVSVALATRLIQRRDWLRSLFGLGQIVITAFLAERAFHLLHPGELAMGSFGTRGALAMLAGGTVYFFVNTWLVAGAVSLERRVPLRTTWIQNYGYRNSVVSSVALFTQPGPGSLVSVDRLRGDHHLLPPAHDHQEPEPRVHQPAEDDPGADLQRADGGQGRDGGRGRPRDQ